MCNDIRVCRYLGTKTKAANNNNNHLVTIIDHLMCPDPIFQRGHRACEKFGLGMRLLPGELTAITLIKAHSPE